MECLPLPPFPDWGCNVLKHFWTWNTKSKTYNCTLYTCINSWCPCIPFQLINFLHIPGLSDQEWFSESEVESSSWRKCVLQFPGGSSRCWQTHDKYANELSPVNFGIKPLCCNNLVIHFKITPHVSICFIFLIGFFPQRNNGSFAKTNI